MKKQVTYKEIGIYVHIPFCQQKCFYCDFCSYAGKEKQIKEYSQYLTQEIKEVGEGNKLDYENHLDSLFLVKTIYIGGGTPSFIESDYIKEVLQTIYEKYVVDENAEITIEVNPRNSYRKKITSLSKNGNQSY